MAHFTAGEFAEMWRCHLLMCQTNGDALEEAFPALVAATHENKFAVLDELPEKTRVILLHALATAICRFGTEDWQDATETEQTGAIKPGSPLVN